MMEDHSFDPRTWKAAKGTSPSASVAAAPPISEPRPRPGEPARAGWLGMALSFTILLAGAAAAYAMRPPQAVPGVAAFNSVGPGAATSASG